MKLRTNIWRGGRGRRFVPRGLCLLTACVVLILIPPVGSETKRDDPQNRSGGADTHPPDTVVSHAARRHQPGDAVRGTLAGGQSVSHQIKLSSGEFLHVTAAQKGVDVMLSLLTPEGKSLVHLNNNGLLYGPESLSWVVGREGVYSLLVSAVNEEAAASAYELTFDERRPAGPKDEVRVAAERRLAAANRHLASGRMPRARQEFRRAGELYRKAGDALQEAGALIQLGHVYRDTGTYTDAIPHYKQALSVSEAADDWFHQASALDSLGVIYCILGDTRKAFEYYERALSLRRDAGERQGEAATLKNMGVAYGNLGKNQMALDSLKQSLLVSREIGDGQGEIDTLLELASVYRFLNERQVALDLSMQALRRSRELHIGSSERYILGLMGAIHRSLGNYEEARETLSRALMDNLKRGDDRGEARCLYDLGDVYASTGNPARSLEYYEKAAHLNARLGDQRGLARALNRVGEIYYQSGQQRQALSAFNRALALSRAVSDRQTEAGALHSLARISREEGDLDHSRSYIEAALRVTDSMRYDIGSRTLRASYSASTQTYYEFYIDLLMQLHRQHPAGGFDLAALEANERARARGLSELLANTRASAGEGPIAESLSGVEAAPPPLTVAEIQAKVVGDDMILLEYALGDQRSFLWAVTRDSVTAYELPDRRLIEEAAQKFYQLLMRPAHGGAADVGDRPADVGDESYVTQAAALSRMLLGPVAGQLGKRRLLIVGPGALQYVPFEALPTPSSTDVGGETNPLMADHVIVYLPSASVLELLRREAASRKPAPKTVAVLADPVFETDDPRLPESAAEQRSLPAVKGFATPRLTSTLREAEAIMAAAAPGQGMMAVDFEASRDTAMSPDLGKYQIVHFATHGFVNTEHPELSGLILSLVDEHGRQQNGILELSDIYNMKLSADLVVLSACETGLGENVRGEGLLGLTRGFMYAGSRGVVASLWNVDDRATAALMGDFYKGMLRDGLTPASALRAAKMQVWRQKRWRHPYYWAGFILQGDGNRNLPTAAEETRHSSFLIAALLPVGIGLLWVGLRRRYHKSVSGIIRVRRIKWVVLQKIF
jgi:CHAT domain-containing protein/tetratricopeptide (TPR) repeat protein